MKLVMKLNIALFVICQDLVDDVGVLEADMTKLKCHAERLSSARHPAAAIVQVRFVTCCHHFPVFVIISKVNC